MNHTGDPISFTEHFQKEKYMSPQFTLTRDGNNYYCRHFIAESISFPRHIIKVYTECTLNSKLPQNNHLYYAEIYYSIDDYALRNFLLGISFGKQKMSKSEIDEYIEVIVNNEIVSSGSHLMNNYLHLVEILNDDFENHFFK